ncbi:MAG: MBL fold metallo-hydrolase [Spirochaetes bacterium]|nr:MBL fold metallo-hydrolase [Spirochaetota bacterium]
MDLVILGTCAAFAGKNEACSSYLLSCGGQSFVIDTGPGSFGVLQRYIHYGEIRGVFLSHLHADHVSDIYTMRYAVFVAQRDGLAKGPLSIYMPKSPKRTFAFIKNAIKREFSIEKITEGLVVRIEDLSVGFLRGIHPIASYAMRFEHRGKTLVYTADTRYFERLTSFAKEADVLLAEATLLEADGEMEEMGHMTAKTAARLASEAKVKRLVLTHVWPEYDRKKTLAEAKTIFDDTAVAECGMTIVI